MEYILFISVSKCLKKQDPDLDCSDQLEGITKGRSCITNLINFLVETTMRADRSEAADTL